MDFSNLSHNALFIAFGINFLKTSARLVLLLSFVALMVDDSAASLMQ
jgi:hypothetical protein